MEHTDTILMGGNDDDDYDNDGMGRDASMIEQDYYRCRAWA